MVSRSRLKHAGAGAKKRERLIRSSSPKYLSQFQGQTITKGDYHSWEVTDDLKNKVSLGDTQFSGWYWDGDDSDMVGYLVRIDRSKIREDFLKDVEGKVDFDDFKSVLKKALEKNDGLYQASGDNVEWKFGGNEWIDAGAEADNLKDNFPKLSKAQAEKIVDDALGNMSISFEEFEKEYDKQYHEEMTKVIDQSHSFKEFFSNLENNDDLSGNGMMEAVNDYYQDKFMREVKVK